MPSRDSILDVLRSGRSPEVLIIGAGINGIGTFRDLAFQGVPALMVDRGDVCSATSSASSRLIHGGLRYLEIGEFALVRESVEERNRLLLDAPHLVRPIRVRIPMRDLMSGLFASVGRFLGLVRSPGPKGALVVALGLMVYDLFGRRDRTMPLHRMVPKREFRRTMRGLDPSIRYMGEYHDARLVAPERLGYELLAQAEAVCPDAMAATYVAVAGRRGNAVVLTDAESGECFTVHPRVVVNCAGARVDEVDLDLGIREKLIGGTKGSHLVLRHRPFVEALDGCMLYFETPDHRICLAYPLDGDHVLLGTTDLRTDDPGDVVCSAAEIDYLFGVMREVMPGLDLDVGQIVHTYAGVRPLPASDGVAGAISRDHSIRVFEPEGDRPFPVLSLVGGKWTTFRACGEEIADAVLKILDRPRRRSTAGVPIGGGADWPADVGSHVAATAARFRIPQARAAILFDRYGTGMTAMLAHFAGETEIPLVHLPDHSRQEIAFLAKNERVVHLVDIVLRRTLVALHGRATSDALAELADVVGTALGWSPERRAEEAQAAADVLGDNHDVQGRPR